jgi:copper resistance protein C
MRTLEHPTKSRPTPAQRLSLAGAAGMALALAIGGPASAHDYVVDSTPSDGEILTELPREWSVTASDALLAVDGNESSFALVVTDAEGQFYGDGCVALAGATLTAAAALGEPGAYTMTFQYVSSDGHTVSDSYDFTYAPSGEQPVSEPSGVAPTCNNAPQSDATAPALGEQDSTAAPALAIGGGLLAVALIAWALAWTRRRTRLRD